MNDDFDGPRFRRRHTFCATKKYAKSRHGTMVPGPSFIHPGFLEGLRHPGLSTGNFSVPSASDRRFSSGKGAALFGIVPQMAGRVAWVKKRKKSYEGNEGHEGVKM